MSRYPLFVGGYNVSLVKCIRHASFNTTLPHVCQEMHAQSLRWSGPYVILEYECSLKGKNSTLRVYKKDEPQACETLCDYMKFDTSRE